MQFQIAAQVLAFELPLPGRDSRKDRGNRGDGGGDSGEVRRSQQRCVLPPLGERVERGAHENERDGKVDERDVLRVLGEQRRFQIEWVHVRLRASLHYDLRRHLGMNGAVVVVGAGLGEGE